MQIIDFLDHIDQLIYYSYYCLYKYGRFNRGLCRLTLSTCLVKYQFYLKNGLGERPLTEIYSLQLLSS
jgi:hypothetical protein